MADYRLGPVIGKIGGGEVETIPVGVQVSKGWARLATVTVEETSLVSAVTTNPYPGTGGKWVAPAPSMRLLPSDGRAPEAGVTEHWAAATTQEIDARLLFSVAAALPPGTYAIELHMQSTGRAYTVEAIHTSIVPL